MPCQLIHDGYTLTATIRGGLNVRYRPMTGPAWIATIEWADKLEAQEAAKRVAEAMAQCLVDWDAIDESGETAPITGENVARLPAPTYTSLRNVLSGWDEEKKENTGDQAEKNFAAG